MGNLRWRFEWDTQKYNYNIHRWVILLKECSSGRTIEAPPPSTQAGCSKRDAVWNRQKGKQQKVASASRRTKLGICVGETKTNTIKCQCISCGIWAFQHATPSATSKWYHKPHQRESWRSGKYFCLRRQFFIPPLENFCIEFVDRSITCEFEHTFNWNTQGIPEGLKYLGVRLLRCCGKVVRVFVYLTHCSHRPDHCCRVRFRSDKLSSTTSNSKSGLCLQRPQHRARVKSKLQL